MPRKLTALQEKLRVRHTRLHKTPRFYRVELVIGNQGFMLSEAFSKPEAEWLRDMLAVALSKVSKP